MVKNKSENNEPAKLPFVAEEPKKKRPSGKSYTTARYREEGYRRIDLWLPPRLLPVLDQLIAEHGDTTKAIVALLEQEQSKSQLLCDTLGDAL